MRIVAISTSKNVGEKKNNVEEALFVVDHGIEGDAHAKNWHRQISLLGIEDIEVMKKAGADVSAGDFAENITTEGLNLAEFPIGTQFKAGETVVLELTQIGKKCHHGCDIVKQVGSCIMPTRGVFCKVLSGGVLRPGDSIYPLE